MYSTHSSLELVYVITLRINNAGESNLKQQQQSSLIKNLLTRPALRQFDIFSIVNVFLIDLLQLVYRNVIISTPDLRSMQ